MVSLAAAQRVDVPTAKASLHVPAALIWCSAERRRSCLAFRHLRASGASRALVVGPQKATTGTSAPKTFRVACPAPPTLRCLFHRKPPGGPDVTSPPSSATWVREHPILSDLGSAAAQKFMELVAQVHRGVATAQRRRSGEHHRARVFLRQVGASGLICTAVPSCRAALFYRRHIPPPRAQTPSRPPTSTHATISRKTSITRPTGRAEVMSHYRRCYFLPHRQGHQRNLPKHRHP